jgi:hypothetical protein
MFYKEKSLNGRLIIFISFLMPQLLKRDLKQKEKEGISVLIENKNVVELKFEGRHMGYIQLIQMTKDFVFTT